MTQPCPDRSRHGERVARRRDRGRTRRPGGPLVLLAGEAGVGKTAPRRGAVRPRRTPRAARARRGPSGRRRTGRSWPRCAARLRAEPGALDGAGAAAGAPGRAAAGARAGRPATSDRATLFEAIRCGAGAMLAPAPGVVLLDDLQWSDEATLELLAALARAAAASCRCWSWPPTAPTSSRARTRCGGCAHDLRRDRALREIDVEPLDRAGRPASWPSSVARASRRRPRWPRRCTTARGGVPFFVEELAAALRGRRPAASGADGLELALDGDVPRAARRSATPCCCAPPALSDAAAPRPRRPRWPAARSTSTSWPR